MKYAIGMTLVCLCVGCNRQQWPEPPAIDQAQYQKQYQTFLDDAQNTARESSKIVGIWRLEEGETPFGSDKSLPIVLPATAVPARAGLFRRTGENVTVTPVPGVRLLSGGKPMTAPSEVRDEMNLGSVRMFVIPMGDGRVFLNASDDEHPVLKDFPKVQTYPVDTRWRVAARFDALDQPKMVRIADVRGGTLEYPVVGRLTFRIGDQELQLTAFGFPDYDQFSIFFKDATNSSTTYGNRIVHAPKVGKGEWTVIDFNFAGNPPCAYSPYTTCPLPPPENRLAVAIEAGEKQFPTGKGFVQQ